MSGILNRWNFVKTGPGYNGMKMSLLRAIKPCTNNFMIIVYDNVKTILWGN